MTPRPLRPRRPFWTLTALMACALPAFSQQEDDEIERRWKLTYGQYRYHGAEDDHGHDVNLRWQQDDTHAWLGAYQDDHVGTQWRAGMDGSWGPVPSLSLQPSLQVASGGFVGGSLMLQFARGPWYGQVGWGRTNLKETVNLNFDPNDAVTLGAGWQGEGGRLLATTLVADDRLHTGQRHWHLIARWPTAPRARLTFDLLRKRGEGDTGLVRAWGWTLTYDAPQGWFVRCARDPKQNFSDQDALRLSLGQRW